MLDKNFVAVADRNGGPTGTYYNLSDSSLYADNGNGVLVRMDTAQSDVHIDTALSFFATGYTQPGLYADSYAPVVFTPKASDYYYEFDPTNSLATVDGTMNTGGANIPEVSVKFSTTAFRTNQFALAGFLPTEVIANQDAVINLQYRLTRMVMERLMLNREVRVKTLAFTTASYTGAHLKDLSGSPSTLKWNGGTASDPVRDIQSIMEASLLPITDMVMSLDTWNAFATNPAVQKYIYAKNAVAPLPGTDGAMNLASLLRLPTPHISEARSLTTGTNFPYVWSGDVALYHQAPGMQADGFTNATAKTFRWNVTGVPDAGSVPGATQGAGITVRSIYNPYRGPRGGIYVVVTHNDAEVFITQNVSGLIHGAFA